jgi:hypothetical protein
MTPEMFNRHLIIFLLAMLIVPVIMWIGNRPPVVKQGYYIHSSTLKIGSEKFDVSIYEGKHGLYIFQDRDGQVFEGHHRFWYLSDDGDMRYGNSRHSYDRNGGRYTVGLVQYIDVHKREMEDKSNPEIISSTMHFQVANDVYGELPLDGRSYILARHYLRPR